MRLHSRSKKKYVSLTLIFIALCVVCVIVFIATQRQKNKVSTNKNIVHSHQKTPAATFDKTTYSVDEPGSLWWVVGKKRPLPADYTPQELVAPQVQLNTAKSASENSLRPETAAAVKELFSAAQAAGFDFMVASGYRSKDLQATYYNNYVKASGQEEADKFSAKPGTSEHQTGLSLDVALTNRKNYLTQAFGNDPSGKWLADNAYKYGFIIRYPQNKESITGYMYEPWHIRFVGKELSAELYKTGQTMEEFFDIH